MKEERVYLLHIRDAVERALSYTAQGKQAFFADPRTQDAVIRNLEVVGEAVKNLSEGLKARRALSRKSRQSSESQTRDAVEAADTAG